MLVVDETGFLKKGPKSAGVQRQYSGTAGRIEHCQMGVFLGYASAKGPALLDRTLYLPKDWLADPPRCAKAGIPTDTPFRMKPQLAQVMLARAVAAGVPFRRVTGDQVEGGDRRRRLWLEAQDLAHVLAIKRIEPLWVNTDRGPHQVAAEVIAAQIPTGARRNLSAGQDSKGPRVYAWACFPIRPLPAPERGSCLLVRRSPATRTISPTMSATARRAPRSARWSGWRGSAGALRKASSGPRAKWGWISTRYGTTPPGTGTSRWRCSPMRTWR